MLMRLTAVLISCSVVAAGQITAVLTRSGDNQRSGSFQDAVLTVAKVRTKGIVRVTTIPVTGDARGMEAQPLILPRVVLADGSTHDVMVLPSMANVVRGVDAGTGAALWSTTLGRPIQGGASIDSHRINDKWGVLSTGVIDPETKLAYMVAWVSTDGTPQRGVHFVYTLHVATGAVVGAPVPLAGLRNGTQGYSDTMRKQRSSLVMTNVAGRKTVFFAYGTVMETGRAAAGAIVAYDVAFKKVTGFLPMSQGLGAGIWMAGQGLAADDAGALYGVTGNGSFNGVNDFGESIFKVTYTPGVTASLKVATWFSPYSDAGRVGLDPTKSGPQAPMTGKLAGVSAPSAEVAMPVGSGMAPSMVGTRTVIARDVNTGRVVPLVYPANPTDPAWSDEDLGSGGCTLVKAYGKLLCGGKDGLGYVVNTANMGDTMPADFKNDKANCQKLATAPVWMTASPGPVDPCPQDTTTLNFMPYGKTRHLHMTPVQYLSPGQGMTIFVGGENSTIHAWAMAPSGQMTYLAESREVASVASTQSPGGMPGSFCALSSDKGAVGTAILWCSLPYGDANATLTTGRLIAYDPENFATDSDGKHLLKLWDSQDWNIQYSFNKFMPPTISGGQIYLPNYNGGVDVYGLGQ